MFPTEPQNPYYWASKSALDKAQQARQRQAQYFQSLTQSGQGVYGSGFSINQSGSPVFSQTGTARDRWRFPWAYENPGAYAADIIAQRGGTTHTTNPFTAYAVNIAEAAPVLFDLMFKPGASSIDAQAPEYFNIIDQIMQALRTPYTGQIDGRLTAKAIGDALRNYNLGEYTDAEDQARQVAILLTTVGRFWLTDTWVKAAIQDLRQKQLDYARYLASLPDPTQAMPFIQFLASTGFIDRYFGT